MAPERDRVEAFIRRLPGPEPQCAYVYDLDSLRRHAEALAASLPRNCELFYAVKANSDLPILKTLADTVKGFEVASGGELGWIREHFAGIPVIFGGPGKLDSELAAALAAGVECLHVESRTELERLAWLCGRMGKTAPILLRINLPLPARLSSTLAMGGRASQFGIEPAQLPACLDWLQRHPQIRLRGFHFHLLSHQLDAAIHLELLALCLRQVLAWRQQFRLTIDQINVGGGIGINYREPERQYSWPALAAGLERLICDLSLERYTLRLELGRYLTAACGFYVMDVVDLKRCFGHDFAVGRGGTHHFRTPYAQGHSHPFFVIPREDWPYPFPRPGIEGGNVTVVGQLCTPKDVLARNVPVARLRMGDRLVFPYAGAYAWHISHHDFLRHPHPQHYYLPVTGGADGA